MKSVVLFLSPCSYPPHGKVHKFESVVRLDTLAARLRVYTYFSSMGSTFHFHGIYLIFHLRNSNPLRMEIKYREDKDFCFPSKILIQQCLKIIH